MISNVLIWVVFGALAGWITSMVLRTNERQGGIEDIVIGIVGAVFGGFIVETLAGQNVNGFNVASLLVAVFGAATLIGLYKTITLQN